MYLFDLRLTEIIGIYVKLEKIVEYTVLKSPEIYGPLNKKTKDHGLVCGLPKYREVDTVA